MRQRDKKRERERGEETKRKDTARFNFRIVPHRFRIAIWARKGRRSKEGKREGEKERQSERVTERKRERVKERKRGREKERKRERERGIEEIQEREREKQTMRNKVRFCTKSLHSVLQA